MATNIWQGAAATVAQVAHATPGSVEIGDIFSVILTDDGGGTHAVSYTAQVASVADVTAGLTAAWNASADPHIARLTATDETTHVELVADEPGRPFALSATAVDGGGADTQTLSVSVVVANAGPHDYGCDANWSLGHVPQAGEDVAIPSASTAILYGLDQSAVAIGAFHTARGRSMSIGRIEHGRLWSLRIDPTSVWLGDAAALVALDLGAAVVDPVVDHQGTPPAGQDVCVYLTGSGLGSLDLRAGQCGVAAWPGQSATLTGTWLVGDGKLVVGRGTTATGTSALVYRGEMHAWVSVPTVQVYQRGRYYQHTGAWTSATAYPGGALYAIAPGTYATTVIKTGAQLDASRSAAAKTLTNATSDGRIVDPARTLIYTNPLGTTLSGTIESAQTGTS